jgi:hypothetical protein
MLQISTSIFTKCTEKVVCSTGATALFFGKKKPLAGGAGKGLGLLYR